MWQKSEGEPGTAKPGYRTLSGGGDDSPRPGGETVFSWNNRECKGCPLHLAVLREDVEGVRRFLREDPSALTRRFTYETKFAGNVQEGSGEAIHLAVTRSSVEIVELLIGAQAALDSMVTRAGQPHYDVLHAAVFSEGRGGQMDVIQSLLGAKAPPTKNLEGHYPLHKAFQTGACVFDAIPMLAEDMKARGLMAAVENDIDGPVATPLQLGIRMRKLTSEQLAQVASMTPVSLKIFLHDEPSSIPAFIERMDKEDFKMDAEELAKHVSCEDVIKCLRECPEAANVLLNALLSDPVVDNQGWHPLPTRVSFGPRNTLDRLKNAFNPRSDILFQYRKDTRWQFDAIAFQSPPWHDEVRGAFGRPICDVSIQVCHLPRVARAEFFSALDAADHDPIFEHDVVVGAISTVWWGGAYKVDILQLIITMCALILLILEQLARDWERQEASSAHSRRMVDFRFPLHLRTSGGNGFGAAGVIEEDLEEGFKVLPSVATAFIGARGFVDLAYELLQFGGFIALRRGRDYINLGNAYDLVRAGLALRIFCSNASMTVQCMLIMMYWFRLLDVSFSESLMRDLLPITQLVRGLGPSTCVCLIAISAFTHAMWVMTSQPLWPRILYDSFGLLVTSALPPQESSDFSLLFAFFAIMCFSIFFLNIFIGVIGERYCAEKEAVKVSLRKKKSSLCLGFLVRAQLLPCGLMSKKVEVCSWFFSALLALTFAVLPSFSADVSHAMCTVAFTLAQCLALLTCYQDADECWSQRWTPAIRQDPRGCSAQAETKQQHLWIISRKQPEDPTPEDGIEETIGSLKDELKDLKERLAARADSSDSIANVACSTT